MYRSYIKHAIDFLIALIIAILVFPFFLFITIRLYRVNKGSAFFYQRRAGKHGIPFYIVKFKTMTDEKDKTGKLLPDADRLTKFGSFLRSKSLDELPQLINVLKGEMSLIGPRPLLVEYLKHYSPKHQRRHEVRPGVTGLAQVHGRNRMLFSQRFDLDVEYVDNVSLAMDFKIILLTVTNVIRADGIVNGQLVDEVDDLGVSVDLEK